MRRYQFRRGSRLSGDAQSVGQALAHIASRSTAAGGPDAEQVVEEARDPASPLHPFLTWDDRAAAAEYRLVEARHLVRSVEVVVEGGEPVRAFFWAPVTEVVPDDGAAILVTVESARGNADLRRRVLLLLHRELLGAERALREFSPTDPLLRPLARLRGTIEKQARRRRRRG